MRTYGLFGAMLLLLTACGTFQEETGLTIFGLGDTPAQPSSDQVVLALHERVEREPMLLCPGVSLTASCEWIEQGDKGALFPPETGSASPAPCPWSASNSTQPPAAGKSAIGWKQRYALHDRALLRGAWPRRLG